MFGRAFGRSFGLYFGVYDWWDGGAAPTPTGTHCLYAWFPNHAVVANFPDHATAGVFPNLAINASAGDSCG